MQVIARALITLSAIVLVAGPSPASAQSHHGAGHAGYGRGWHGGHGGWGPGPFWGALGLGLGLGFYYGAPYYLSPWAPGYVVVDPPPVVVVPPASAAPAAPASRPAAEPVVYPRNGQSPEQTRSDRQACESWAAAYPQAQTDASVYERAVVACMDGRGYTVR